MERPFSVTSALYSSIAGWHHTLGHTPTNGLNSLADTFGVCACRPMHTHTTIHRAVTDSWQWRPALFFTVLFYKNYYKSKAAKLSAPLLGTGLIIIESRTYNANCCYCIIYASWSRTSSISIIAEPRKLFIKCIVKNRTIEMCMYESHNFYMREILLLRAWNTHCKTK